MGVGLVPVSLKGRLSSWRDLVKLIALTILIPLLLIPLAYHERILTASDAAEVVLQMLGFELVFLILMVLPPAFLLLGIGYAITRKAREKKIENAGYGYIIGFLIGIVGIGAFFGIFMSISLELAGILGVAAAGLGIGVGLSYVSIRPSQGKNPLR